MNEGCWNPDKFGRPKDKDKEKFLHDQVDYNNKQQLFGQVKDHDKHECEDRERQILYLWGSWMLDDGHDSFIDIYYCPYCGVKLPTNE